MPKALDPLMRLLAGHEAAARRSHARLLDRDTTLWPGPPEGTGAWLGWLDGVERAPEHRAHIDAVVASLRSAGITDVVLTGMGGSSLFPMVLRAACGRGSAHPDLHVIDSTDPATVARIESRVDWARTALLVASKSGTTVETRAHLDRFRMRLEEAVGASAAGRIVVVTDPGSELAQLAQDERFGAVVHGDGDVGGRYSALSPFGLLPAALIGADVDQLLMHVAQAMAAWEVDPWSDAGPAQLGALMSRGVAAGRDALFLVVAEAAGGLGSWIEQLVAESSGKRGTGVLPIVVGRCSDVAVGPRTMVVTVGSPDGSDALAEQGVPVLRIPWDGARSLAREAMRWMQAVPLACAGLGVDPFDQPDVATAKAATAAALRSGAEPDEPVPLGPLEAELRSAGYVALLVYADPEAEVVARLARAAPVLTRRFGVPVTLGIGPRYLHSTGQLHKGGRPDGVHLVLIDDDPIDVDIPARPTGFSRLKRAQAAGDLSALRQAGRRAYRIALDDPFLAPRPEGEVGATGAA